MKFVFFSFFFSACTSLSLFAFTPGKWSYTDQFLFFKGRQGPTKEIVTSSDGKLIYSAVYSYNSDGKLISESYFNSAGKTDGNRTFEYNRSNQLLLERSFDAEGNLFEKKEFIYIGTQLKKIAVKDPEGKSLIHYSINMNKEGSLIGSEGKNFITGDVESFRIEIDPKNPLTQIQILNDDKKKKVGEIILRFDQQKRLLEREFIQGELQRLSKMEYDANGLLVSYTFHVKQAENWVLEKTHTLQYEAKKN